MRSGVTQKIANTFPIVAGMRPRTGACKTVTSPAYHLHRALSTISPLVTLVLVVHLEALMTLTHPWDLLVIHTVTLDASNFILKWIAKVNPLNSQDVCGTVAHIIAMNKTWKMYVIQKSTVRHAKL